MRNPFAIDRSYTNRHGILAVLYKDWKSHGQDYNRSVDLVIVAEETNLLIAEIQALQYLLMDKGEIVITFNDGHTTMAIQQNGVTAYLNNLYINDGKRNRWDKIWDWARMLLPLLAIIFTIINFVWNNSINSKIKVLEAKIEKLKK